MASTDISSITTGVSALGNLVLVTPQNVVGYQPQNSGKSTPQGNPLIFHLEKENTVTLKSNITDHYIEDNTAIQDHIGLAPEVITVHGYIGELTDALPTGAAGVALQALKTVADKLTVIDAYTPVISTTAILAYNEAVFAYDLAASVAQSAASITNIFGGGGEAVVGASGISNTGLVTQNQQQLMFQKFYGLWRARTLFTVQTPWAVFQNCAIESLRAIQGEETNVISDFEVSFKVLRFASTSLYNPGSLTSDNYQGRAAYQSSEEVDLGTQPVGASQTFSVSGVA